MSTPDSFYIRHAQPGEAKIILQLITELAEYEEKMYPAAGGAVKNNEEKIQRNIFGEHPYAHVLLAFQGTKEEIDGSSLANRLDKSLGMALYFFNYSTWTGEPGLYLEDLVVRTKARRLGVGRELFRELHKIVKEKGCLRLDWAVLEGNKDAQGFYSKLAANHMKDWWAMRRDGVELDNLDVALDKVKADHLGTANRSA